MEKFKYYVVWEGLAPGIYDSWEECREQVENVRGAKYKSYNSKEMAIRAFRAGYGDHIEILDSVARNMSAAPVAPVAVVAPPSPVAAKLSGYIRDSIAVDAACSGNPGPMEYRGVYVQTGQELFRIGPFDEGTNNVGEFLALVHGLAFMKKNNVPLPLYTDSRNAMAWLRQKQCKTQLARTVRNEVIFDLIQRAETWLRTNTYTTQVLKWETKLWGEIPADFGRK